MWTLKQSYFQRRLIVENQLLSKNIFKFNFLHPQAKFLISGAEDIEYKKYFAYKKRQTLKIVEKKITGEKN